MKELKNDNEAEWYDESIEDEKVHRPWIGFSQEAAVTEYLKNRETKAVLQALAALLVLAYSPQRGAAGPSISEQDESHKDQKSIKHAEHGQPSL